MPIKRFVEYDEASPEARAVYDKIAESRKDMIYRAAQDR